LALKFTVLKKLPFSPFDAVAYERSLISAQIQELGKKKGPTTLLTDIISDREGKKETSIAKTNLS
jgi:hypothetical protein